MKVVEDAKIVFWEGEFEIGGYVIAFSRFGVNVA